MVQPDGKPVLTFWYEFASTYSYPAAMRIEDVAETADVTVRWQPFLLGPIFARHGMTTSPFNLNAEKGTYMWRDMARICEGQRLAVRRPDPFPQNGLLAARVALALPDDGARGNFSKQVYLAEFARGLQIDDAGLLKSVLADLGEDAEGVLAAASSDQIKSLLREAVAQAQLLGIFGAPTFITPDGELFWGNDRLDDALIWCLQRHGL